MVTIKILNWNKFQSLIIFKEVSIREGEIMKTLKFATDINNPESINRIKSKLDVFSGISEWNIDTENPNKILTVKGEEIAAADISRVLFDEGFRSAEILPGWKKKIKNFFTKDCCK